MLNRHPRGNRHAQQQSTQHWPDARYINRPLLLHDTQDSKLISNANANSKARSMPNRRGTNEYDSPKGTCRS